MEDQSLTDPDLMLPDVVLTESDPLMDTWAKPTESGHNENGRVSFRLKLDQDFPGLKLFGYKPPFNPHDHDHSVT